MAGVSVLIFLLFHTLTKFIATAPSDNAMGSFTMFNMILYFIWGVLLIRNRQSILLETTVDNQQQHAYDDNNDQENPTFENDDFETHEKHEEEEL